MKNPAPWRGAGDRKQAEVEARSVQRPSRKIKSPLSAPPSYCGLKPNPALLAFTSCAHC